ncbi:MAG: response regulator transcription factor [Candidatus Melainabacteria bacterium]|nr:MAG: response regulator transcription factor [Candidatus Melainabacteria bacterium]
MAKILVVEDDKELVEVLQEWLVGEHHIVDVVNDGKEGCERLRMYDYDIAILDWQLPGMDGPDIVRHYRGTGGNIPLLMLTGKTDYLDKEQGLDSGADDYLTKPFHPRELSARLRALLRRSGANRTDSVLTAGDLTLDPQAFKVMKGDKELSFLPREFALLEFFMRHPNEVFGQEAILNHVWSSESDAAPDTVRVHITRLRSKIDNPGEKSFIHTVHRVGYRFEPPQK